MTKTRGTISRQRVLRGTIASAPALVPEDDLAGWIYIADLLGQTTEVVSAKTYQDAGNTVLQTAISSGPNVSVALRASYPLVDVNGTPGTLVLQPGDSHYSGTVDVTVAGGGAIVAKVLTPDDADGATDQMILTVDAPPEILTLSFTAGYPGSQTELKEGDSFQLTGTTDKPIDAVEIQNLDAMQLQLVVGQAGTAFVVTGTIADRGNSPQLLAANVRARDASGAFGTVRSTNAGAGGIDGTDVVNLNDLHPTVDGVTNGSFPGHAFAITYPATQGALKAAEAATIVNPASSFDVIAYDDPVGGELTITNAGVHEDPKTVNRAGGVFNDSSDNFRVTATRNANAAVTVVSGVAVIANVAPTIDITLPAARLRSGGNNGTAAQDHVVTVTSDQPLAAAPVIAADAGGNRGAFQGGGFAGGPSVWTRSLRVDETVPDEKGTFAFDSLVATGLSGLVQNAINSGAPYTLGGFVPRTLTFGPFATTTVLGVEVVDFSKISAGIFTSTNNVALRQPIGTAPSVTDGYTIDAVAIDPTSLIWLDAPAAGANSGGTATITNVQEAV